MAAYLIHQYDHNGHAQVVDQALSDVEAQRLCAAHEDLWQHNLYGACYYSLHGTIRGDRSGSVESEQTPYWERCGNVMTGREF